MITKLKDFILDEIPEEAEAKKKSQPEYTFTLEYENDSDFIIKKTSSRSEKLLVVLVSQGQIYIKDTKKNTISKVDDIAQIRRFRQGLKHSINFTKLTWSPFMNELNDFKLLLSNVDICKELMNKKLNPFKDYKLYISYKRDKCAFTNQFEKMKALQLLTTDIKFSDVERQLQTMIKSNITYNQIKDNLDLIKEFGVDEFLYVLNHNRTHLLFDTYKCDFKALLTWLTYTMKHRNRINFSYNYWSRGFDMGDYVDYLETQYQMYGKIKTKYPENWLTEKHIMNVKHEEWSQLKSNQEYGLHQEKLIETAGYENKEYKVVVPITNVDILDEAEQQQHCVASYIDKITKGETNILFIRKKENLEASLLTVELRDGVICQVRGFQNRIFTKEEFEFMEEWSKKKGLKLGVKI
jgi:hypothetical protein